MSLDMEWVREVCDRAGLRGRQRQVVELRAAGKSVAEVAAELGIAVDTVYQHHHKARKKLGAAKLGLTERELLHFILTEAMRGPKPSNPKVGLYRRLPGGGGERVRVSGGPLVSVDDLDNRGGKALGWKQTVQ